MVDLRGSRYALSEQRFAELTKSCIGSATNIRSNMAVVVLSGSSEESNVARHLERQIFDRTFGDRVPHTPELMTHEYGPYEDQSTFFLALDTDKSVPLGALRVVSGLPNKTTADLQQSGLLADGHPQLHDCEPENTWDVATVAVAPKTGARTAMVATMALYRTLYLRSLSNGIEYWTSIIDGGVSKSYEKLGIPFTLLVDVPPLNYLGSDAFAFVAKVNEVRPSMTARAKSAGDGRLAHRIFSMLDGATFLPDPSLSTIRLDERPVADNSFGATNPQAESSTMP